MIGSPDKVVAALEGYVEKMKITGQSKDEYEAALPALVILVKANSGVNVGVSLTANGHGGKSELGSYGSCNVDLKQLYGLLA